MTMYKSEQIAQIKWTVTGKVSDVTRTGGSSKPDLHFDYDAMGQRISKTVTNKNTTDGTDKFVTTYYVRDPQGNVLAVYEHKHGDSDNGTFTLAEQHLYGAGRLGMRKRDLALNVANASESTPTVTHYELTNHLGNVLAVISDEASDTSEPTVVSLSDYYPFGMTEPGRSWNSGDYRFGYTGHEKENDLAEGVYITEYRLLDTRLGRWLSVDPQAKDYAGASPYEYCAESPVSIIDPDGRDLILLIWASHNGEVGHAGVAVSNYKEISETINVNGKLITQTKMVPDGTYTYRDLWPTKGVNKSNFNQDVKACYSADQFSLIWMVYMDPTRNEERPADGIIRFSTDYELDKKIFEALSDYEISNPNYNGLKNNCSDYAEHALETMTGKQLPVDENLTSEISATTPNQVYKVASKLDNGKIIKDPGEKVSKGFLESVTKGGVKQKIAESKIE